MRYSGYASKGGVRHETGGDIERQLGPLRERRPMSFREDTPVVQRRAREQVAAWRQQHPEDTPEEMLTVLADGFPRGYAVFLRSALYLVDNPRGPEAAVSALRSDGAVR
jgi:hypothetical protein